MVDRATREVYERQAREWVDARSARDLDDVAWVQRTRAPGPVVDIGCGPGWHLAGVGSPAVALDVSSAMLAMVPANAVTALRVQAAADGLPFRRGSLGGALANRVYVHLSATAVPMAMADLHRALAPDAPVFVRVIGDESGVEYRDAGRFAGRLFSGWGAGRFAAVCRGAGFAIERFDRHRSTAGPTGLAVRLRRQLTLPDTIGPGMRLLICGLNPSIYSAEVGVGFARPGNRFWPAALAAGLVSADRDPRRALLVDGVGMTDLVKRPTRRADELADDEYRGGLSRLEAVVDWLRPSAVCFVGLAGWRAAIDRRAVAGPQDRTVGGRPVYLMPSTSGLNASSRPADLTAHLAAAATLADRAH